MPIVAGIDEAGYGPMLGPLVVASVSFRQEWDEGKTGRSWASRDHATSGRGEAGRGIRVCDSKKLYSPRKGLAELEKSVLAFFSCLHPGASFGAWEELLEEISPGHCEKLREIPWYRDARIRLPVEATRVVIGNGVEALGRSGEASALRGVRCEIVEPQEFNRLVDSGLNKADLLFAVTSRLIGRLWEECRSSQTCGGSRSGARSRLGTQWFSGLCLFRTPDGGCGRLGSRDFLCHPRLVVHAGKHGGKTYYARNLQAVFPESHIVPLKESPADSVYCVVSDSGDAMLVSFLRDGEDRNFGLALASLFAKYVRELHMLAFNEYWSKRLPNLARTSGYHCDARKFLARATPLLETLSIPPEMLVRAR
ncbi:MAG: hypothetical protein RDV41_15470 [Planctomycetota bacterium]|nr:hypothetical protein [Planctomycetota bacterium]